MVFKRSNTASPKPSRNQNLLIFFVSSSALLANRSRVFITYRSLKMCQQKLCSMQQGLLTFRPAREGPIHPPTRQLAFGFVRFADKLSHRPSTHGLYTPLSGKATHRKPLLCEERHSIFLTTFFNICFTRSHPDKFSALVCGTGLSSTTVI